MTERDLTKKHKTMLEKFNMMTRVDESDLSAQLAKNSSLMFSIGVMKADAEFQKDTAENRVKVMEAKVDKMIRNESKRKPSEEAIKKRIARHPKVIAAQRAYHEAKWKFNVCWTAATSISQKGEQLTNMAYNYRKELEHGVKSRVSNANKKAKDFGNRKRSK